MVHIILSASAEERVSNYIAVTGITDNRLPATGYRYMEHGTSQTYTRTQQNDFPLYFSTKKRGTGRVARSAINRFSRATTPILNLKRWNTTHECSELQSAQAFSPSTPACRQSPLANAKSRSPVLLVHCDLVSVICWCLTSHVWCVLVFPIVISLLSHLTIWPSVSLSNE